MRRILALFFLLCFLMNTTIAYKATDDIFGNEAFVDTSITEVKPVYIEQEDQEEQISIQEATLKGSITADFFENTVIAGEETTTKVVPVLKNNKYNAYIVYYSEKEGAPEIPYARIKMILSSDYEEDLDISSKKTTSRLSIGNRLAPVAISSEDELIYSIDENIYT